MTSAARRQTNPKQQKAPALNRGQAEIGGVSLTYPGRPYADNRLLLYSSKSSDRIPAPALPVADPRRSAAQAADQFAGTATPRAAIITATITVITTAAITTGRPRMEAS